MPYDEQLAERIRVLLAGEEGFDEKRMFGGLAFLLRGNLSVAASHDGGLLARVDPSETEACAALPHASRMQMRKRSPEGWIRVASQGVAREGALASWVDRSLKYVRTLPPK